MSQTDLTERLKALAKPQFTPISDENIPVLETTSVTAPEEVVTEKPKEEKKPVTDLSDQVKEQIKRNVVANAALNNKKIEFTNEQKVLQVLKDCGMDTQMAERAYKMLREL